MQYIILLHGLGSNKFLMFPLQKYLEKQHKNFIILNYQFNSIFQNISNICDTLIKKIKKDTKNATNIIFIGHSLGGLISFQLAEYFSHIYKVSCITLGTPYRGAYLANFFRMCIPLLDKISPILHNLSRNGNFQHQVTNVHHHVIIGTRKIDIFNPISWITNTILLPFDHHDGVVELFSSDFDHLKNKTLYFTDCDHVHMIFDSTTNKLLSQIILHIVDQI